MLLAELLELLLNPPVKKQRNHQIGPGKRSIHTIHAAIKKCRPYAIRKKLTAISGGERWIGPDLRGPRQLRREIDRHARKLKMKARKRMGNSARS